MLAGNTGLQEQSLITVTTSYKPAGNFYHITKRCLDIVIACEMVFVLSWVMLVIAVLIKLDTSGPVIFSQERVRARLRSRNGVAVWEPEIFRVYKFRTMYHGADESAHKAYIEEFIAGRVEPSDGAGAKFKLTNDPRVTRIGRLLRKSSLDELPQL